MILIRGFKVFRIPVCRSSLFCLLYVVSSSFTAIDVVRMETLLRVKRPWGEAAGMNLEADSPLRTDTELHVTEE